MHVLYVHKEFPGHFGHLARYLAEHHGIECSFVYSNIPSRFGGRLPPGLDRSVRLIPYQTRGASKDTHFCNLHTEISMWNSMAVYQTLKARPEIKPDLIVGHAGFGTALFLRDLYPCPLIVHCEFFERAGKPYLFSRPEFPPNEMDILRTRAQNATNLLNLEACTAAYSPTDWQRSLFPVAYQGKISTIFDGIDRRFWYRRPAPHPVADALRLPPGRRVVTYVSYGLEAIRGFDIFMKVAKRICDARSDVIFVVVGADRIYYGHHVQSTAEQSFYKYAVSQDQYDFSRFFFTGQVAEAQLVEILSLSDLHIYLTIPFVLSWSLFDALSCGCTVLASDTEPVREVIRHEENGLLADFDNVDSFSRLAFRVLDDPAQFRALGEKGVRLIDEKYSLEKIAPRMLDFYQQTIRTASA
jgi:glycosyltransferase involved in cell wall biosynthesis